MKKAIATLSAFLLALGMTSCTNNENTADSTDTINIVTSTSVWGDIATAVADTAHVEVTVTPIITGGAVDPHHFEPTARDIATAAEADLIVVGGGGYDAWLYTTVTDVPVISAMELSGDHSAHDHAHDHPEDNEHIWFDTEAVATVAEQIAAKINELDPAAGANAEDTVAKLDTLHERSHNLPALRYAQTEPIADYLFAHAPLTDVTPTDYRTATLNHQTPSAAAVAAFYAAIESGEVQVLIYNPQTTTELTATIKDAAVAAGVPVVEIGETPAEGTSYFDFVEKAMANLEALA